jgi:hypothetical protein
MTEDEKVAEIWRRGKSPAWLKRLGLPATKPQSGPNVGDVTEGPIVGALVSVFQQLEEMGARHAGD